MIAKKINLIIRIVVISILLIFLSRSVYLENYENIMPILSTILLIFIPEIIFYIFKIKIPYSLISFYTIFIFISKYLGGNNFFYSTMPYYDKIVHMIYGVFCFFVSLLILKKNNIYIKEKLILNIILIISITLASSTLWEIFEYLFDVFFHQNNQRLETGVNDTMIDLIVELVGVIIPSVIYILEQKLNKNGIINKYISKIN